MFAAVSVWPCVAVPVIVTEPVGASLRLATAAVAVLVWLSAVPWPSVYEAVTVIALPTSAWVSLKVEAVAPLITLPLAFHW